MLDFATQKLILDPILKNPKNHICADCDTISPTWASLDFGVFLCSNCSGAHRSLGPTITRVRSANLDIWQKEWVSNMTLGNVEINKYWQSNPMASAKKPKIGATLNQINLYVREKYVKKNFVKDLAAVDPLTSYKNGTYEISKTMPSQQDQSKPSKAIGQEPKRETTSTPSVQAKTPQVEVSLLEFDFDVVPAVQPVLSSQTQQPVPLTHHHQDDEFTDYAQAGSITIVHKDKSDDLISFDALLNQHKQVPQVSHPLHSYNDLKSQNMSLHHPYNPMIGQHNLVYNAQFHQPHTQPQHYPQYYQYTPQNVHPINPYSGNTGYPNVIGVSSYWK